MIYTVLTFSCPNTESKKRSVACGGNLGVLPKPPKVSSNWDSIVGIIVSGGAS